MVALCYATRFLPNNLVNLPNREFWLASERRQETAAYVGRHSLWLACMMVLFFTGLHLLVVVANRPGSRELSMSWILVLTFGLLAGTGVWAAGLLRHFNRVPPDHP